jgi:hypothetical protein
VGRTTAGKDGSPVREAVGEEPGGRRVEIVMQKGRNSILPGVFVDGRGETSGRQPLRRQENEERWRRPRRVVSAGTITTVGGHHYDGRRAPLRQDMVREGGRGTIHVNTVMSAMLPKKCKY